MLNERGVKVAILAIKSLYPKNSADKVWVTGNH